MKNKTIEFFKEIVQIPRESGNEREIAQYLCEFAKKRKLDYSSDKYNNVIIKKKTCNKPSIILQAHTDMVCEKEEKLKFNFLKDSIQLIEENGYLTAKGTTLGADNGIGVAQILNILDSDIPCNIEAVFTTSEETTMSGAINFDASNLSGKYMINLDGFEENTIIVESASFNDIIVQIPKYEYTETGHQNAFEIEVSGLLGGHSGFDIDKNRGNANIILAELLTKIDDICISQFIGGTKFNVIPSNAKCIFYTNLTKQYVEDICLKLMCVYKNKELKISVRDSNKRNEAISNSDSKQFIDFVKKFMHGVIWKNSSNEPTTSVNLGVVDLGQAIVKIGMRSSRKEEEKQCIEMLKSYCCKHNFSMEIIGHQPGFQSSKNSKLISGLLKAYPRDSKCELPTLKSVHITVEAGLFKEKLQNLDIAIISPKIENAHTTNERVEISSVISADKWLEEFIKQY